ncbi:MAG: hypothetical protein PVG65_00395 [Candidatus Thorarchaeota archaeon]
MFKSFNTKYPEYEVITPQTHNSYHLRSLNVQEEERLKASFLTPAKITEHLNKCIYDSLVSKPKIITSYDDFLKNVTLKDRDALVYGLYHITYEEIRDYEVMCPRCAKSYPVRINASETFNMNEYPEKDILKKKINVELPMTPGVSAIVRQPSLFDEMSAYKTLGAQPNANADIITETLVIDSFEQIPEEGDKVIYDGRGDIVDAYLTLPARDKRKIHASYKKAFGQYGVFLKMKSYCVHCGEEDLVDLDLVQNFFRMVYTIE